MASTIIEITLPTGLSSPTVDIFPLNSTTADASGLTLTEETNALGYYRATVTGALSGTKRLALKDGGTWIATTYLYLEDDTSVWREVDISQLAGTQPDYAPAKETNQLQKGTQYRWTNSDGDTKDVTFDDVP